VPEGVIRVSSRETGLQAQIAAAAATLPGTTLGLWERVQRSLPKSGTLGPLAGGALLGLAYLASARLGRSWPFPSAPLSALWLPNSIVLAALLLAPRRTWWWYLAALLPVHLLARMPFDTDLALIRSLLQYGTNCCTALIGALGLSSLAPPLRRIDQVGTAVSFVFIGGLLAPISTSVLLAAALAAIDGHTTFWITAAGRSLTNSFAILTVTPLTLSAAAWLRGPRESPSPGRAAEACLLAVCLASLGILGFIRPTDVTQHAFVLLYAPFAVLLWAALRFGVAGSCATMLALGALAIWGALHQTGPFVAQSPDESLISLLLFLVLTAMIMLVLPAAIEERAALARADATSRGRFRSMFEHNLVPTLIWNRAGQITDANAPFLELTGYTRQDLRNGRLKTAELLGTTGPTPAAADANTALVTDGGPVERELLLRSGARVPVLLGGRLFPGNAREGAAYLLDLSTLRRVEAERRQAEMLHSSVLASLHDQVAVLDGAGVVIETNQSWRRFAEQPSANAIERADIGDQLLQLCAGAATGGDGLATALREQIQDILRGVAVRRRLEFSRNTEAGTFWQEIFIERLQRPEGGVVITRTDITAHKRVMEEAREQRQQLAHLGRAAVLGELSGAFAHELAQPLTSILGNAEAALQMVPAGSELAEILGDIVREDVRAAEVIRRLRSMLARGEIQREVADLNQVVRDALALAHGNLVTHNVAVSVALDPQLPSTLIDRVQLQQVMLNLIVNACEAMAEQPAAERELTITTRSADQGALECSVTDRGPGIAAGQLEGIFQAFVSSKKQGMGLGLAICRSIIEAHGGRLWAENGLERGAILCFRVPVQT